MELTRRQVIALAGAGGAVLGASFPPWSLPWLAPLAVASFVVAVGRRPGLGAAAGLTFGAVHLGVASWWLVESITPAAWAALTAAQSLWFALLGAAVALLRRLRGWPVWVACAWSAAEGARSEIGRAHV